MIAHIPITKKEIKKRFLDLRRVTGLCDMNTYGGQLAYVRDWLAIVFTEKEY
jgi:hypothetical protein